MALPAQALEKLAHSSETTTGVYSQLLMLSLSLLILALFLFAGLTFGYEPYLEGRVDKLDEQINKFGQEIPADKQAEMATFYSQITNLKQALKNHVSTSLFWSWLERNTLPNVYFNKVNLNIASNQIILQGGAKSSEDIMAQLAILEKSPEVDKMVFGGMQNSSQGWQFNLTLFMKDSFFVASATNPQ